jgi:hypothetical protein
MTASNFPGLPGSMKVEVTMGGEATLSIESSEKGRLAAIVLSYEQRLALVKLLDIEGRR